MRRPNLKPTLKIYFIRDDIKTLGFNRFDRAKIIEEALLSLVYKQAPAA